MFFSEKFNVSSDTITKYGAVDISLVCDIPLFIDPMLIFNSDKKEYKKLHKEIIKYFHFLYSKSKENLKEKEINAWFNFSEIPNNWLGYSSVGNRGSALGKQYSQFLYKNIAFALNTNNISKSRHIEKVMLIYEGTGKDKISDLTVNLIVGFLCEYTEKFSKKYINPVFLKSIPVEKACFNYSTESFISKEFILPITVSKNGKIDYVLLTPFDILRKDGPSINKDDFYNSHERIRDSIDNPILRAQVDNYIGLAIKREEEKQKNKKPLKEKTIAKIEKATFIEATKQHPELYDYYIKLMENNTKEILSKTSFERKDVLEKIVETSKNIISIFKSLNYQPDEKLSAREEAKNRLKFFKHIIEDCDGYKSMYYKGKQIAKEKDLQILFKFVWSSTEYKVDAEANNGRGQADFIASYGQKNQVIIEFKLASNPKLSHMFKQIKIYEAANCADNSLIVIFYFSEVEYLSTMNIIREERKENLMNDLIYLIDCRNDNKQSASKV